MKKSILAGVLIAIGALFSIAAKPYGNVVQGLCFSVGLFEVLCLDAKLFTGYMIHVRDVWNKRTTPDEFIGMAAAIWSLNLVGAVIMALMASQTGFDALGIAQAKAAMPPHELLIRAALCNFMVCMAVAVGNARTEIGHKLIACLLPVACFVACGWEHSVADMLYMPLGLLQGAVDVWQCAYVVLIATVGNVLGGILFSWLLYEKRAR